MINITSKGNFKNGYIIEGHAEYAPYGQDIVCSAVSVLAQCITSAILCYDEKDNVKCKMSHGYIHMDIGVRDTRVDALLFALRQGLESIALQYPNHVRITEENSFKEEK